MSSQRLRNLELQNDIFYRITVQHAKTEKKIGGHRIRSHGKHDARCEYERKNVQKCHNLCHFR